MSPITLANCEGVIYFGKVYSRIQIPALVVLKIVSTLSTRATYLT
jgi:hypothetical protein